tara:strand:- start:102 stop:302 length:201 start_codon:yes stop_codon:yes gene_type:complete
LARCRRKEETMSIHTITSFTDKDHEDIMDFQSKIEEEELRINTIEANKDSDIETQDIKLKRILSSN